MRRWIINLLCGLSLLIFLLAMGIWVRSYFVWDQLARAQTKSYSSHQGFRHHVVYIGITSTRGALALCHEVGEFWDDQAPPANATWRFGRSVPQSMWDEFPSSDVHFRLFGFGYLSRMSQGEAAWAADSIIIFPFWLFVPFAIPPLLRLRRYRHSRGRGFPIEPTRSEAPQSTVSACGA